MGAQQIPHKATLRIYNNQALLYIEEFRATSISTLFRTIQANLIEQLKIYSPQVKRGLKYSIDMEQI